MYLHPRVLDPPVLCYRVVSTHDSEPIIPCAMGTMSTQSNRINWKEQRSEQALSYDKYLPQPLHLQISHMQDYFSEKMVINIVERSS
jgi:hypothetical protein